MDKGNDLGVSKKIAFPAYCVCMIMLLIAVIFGLEIWHLRQGMSAAEFFNESSIWHVKSGDAPGTRDCFQSYFGRYWGDAVHFRLNPPQSVTLTHPDNRLVEKLSELRALKSLTISGYSETNKGRHWSVSQLRLLQSLESFSLDRTADPNGLLELLSFLPRMKSISFYALRRERVSLKPILRLKSLSSLELGECDLVDAELVELCRQTPLNEIKLLQCRILDQFVTDENHRSISHLNSIDLRSVKSSGAWLQRVMSTGHVTQLSVQICGGLFQEVLEGTGCESLSKCVVIEPEGGAIVDLSRWKCSKLESLKLVIADLSDRNLQDIMRFTELTDLSLKCQPLREEQFQLPSKIRTLALPRNQSFSPGIWEALRSMPQLNILDISEAEVDDSDISEISRLQFIQELDVRHTRCTEQGIDTLKALMPGVNIRHSWTEEDKLLLEFLGLPDKSVEQ